MYAVVFFTSLSPYWGIFVCFFSFLFLVLCLLDLWVTIEHSDHECRCLDFLYVVLCIFALCILRLYYWVHLGFYHYNKTFTKSFYFQAYLFDIVFHTLLSSFIWSIFLTDSIAKFEFLFSIVFHFNRRFSLFTFTVITMFRCIFTIFCAVCPTFCFLSPFWWLSPSHTVLFIPSTSLEIHALLHVRLVITPKILILIYVHKLCQDKTSWNNRKCQKTNFFFISWRLITLQYCSGFCHTLTWISHGFTCIPHPDHPSQLPLHPISLGLPSAPAPSTCLMHPTWAGDLFHLR